MTLQIHIITLTRIGKKAFVGLESLYKLDLRFNHLFSLDERTFRGLTSHNLASSQQNNIASPRQMQVSISNNPWLCNCLLAWIKRSILQSQNGKLLSDLTSGEQRKKRKNFFDERYPIGYNADNNDVTSHNLYYHNKHDVKFNNILDIFADIPICHRPSLIKGLPLSKVNDNDLHCNHDYYYYADDDDVGATTATTTTAKMGLSRVSNNSLTK
ncbi:hypothetical protein HELRODRAFT_184046 [Helobdella robusta]|uniref:LRRCT domain-containing protein n=1 Tax=Helobdella robusta TaxID=6412 RepID=T1FKH3_HELRO|nr:hypothetical protein HELRODRAFT_184046 [Helobdella robusta]ESO08670.1 hypothetical protein HELRODRAFT_184046 [Helobdella robusta]